MKQLIGWVCVSNKFLSTLAKVPMLEWPGSDVDRAQRLMDQGSEAPTACSSFFVGEIGGGPGRVRFFQAGLRLLMSGAVSASRGRGFVPAGPVPGLVQARAAKAPVPRRVRPRPPPRPVLRVGARQLRLCSGVFVRLGPQVPAGARARPPRAAPACAQRDCRCQALPGEPRGCGAVSFKLTFRFVAV